MMYLRAVAIAAMARGAAVPYSLGSYDHDHLRKGGNFGQTTTSGAEHLPMIVR
jgi:hypothetical protein